jgi:hypothetical protein
MRCSRDALFWVKVGALIAAGLFVLFGATGLLLTVLDPYPIMMGTLPGMTIEQTTEYVNSGHLYRTNLKLYGLMVFVPVWVGILVTVATFVWKDWNRDEPSGMR